MSIVRTVALLGVAYYVVRKLKNAAIPAAAMSWQDAESTGVDLKGAAPPAQAQSSADPQPYGGNGAFGSHAPFGDGTTTH
jgi:hypothetical protein